MPILTAAESPVSVSEDCIAAPFDRPGTARQNSLSELLREFRAILAEYPAMLSTLDTRVSLICLSDGLVEEKAYLDADEGRIVLASDMSDAMKLAVLVHEIRHADQLARGICPSDQLAMEQYARATFSMEADATAVSLIVAWHQRASGNAALWRALESWPMTADIANRFGETMVRTQDLSAAATSAFEQWYASDRRRELYYVASCSAYLDRQDEAHALPRYRMLPDDHFSELCRMPDGQSYQCAEPDAVLQR